MRVVSLFSGIGAFEKALTNIGVKYELVNYCEIDQYAAKAYAQIHGVSQDLNLRDVTKIDTAELKDIDLITYGFPCQDISIAGKQKGFTNENGERTRSGLFFEALRVIQDTKPRYAIAENVKALTSKKFKAEFETVLTSLEETGYNNYYAVLNAKDYGIPQNRERVFIISIRKDIDTGIFKFPEKRPLDLRLKDILEDNVDEKYYLNSDRAKSLIAQIQERYTIQESEGVSEETAVIEPPVINRVGAMGKHETDEVLNICGVSKTLKATDYKNPVKIMAIEPKIKLVGHMDGYQTGRVYDPSGIACTLQSRDYKDPLRILEAKTAEPQVLRYERTEYGKAIRSQYEKGEVSEKRCNMREFRPREDGISNTLTTVLKDNYLLEPPKVQRLGNLYNENAGGARAGNTYDPDGLAPTLQTSQGGNRQPLIVEPVIAASSGRNPDNPSDLTTGIKTEQRLEINTEGVSNTLTTVQKDNYVLEPAINEEDTITVPSYSVITDLVEKGFISEPYLRIKEATKQGYAEAKPGDSVNLAYPNSTTRRGRVGGEVSNTLTTGEQIGVVTPELRIRKLTPRECWRLMGFSDDDFSKVEGISNTQLYKMAGNSIVVQVLEAIF